MSWIECPNEACLKMESRRARYCSRCGTSLAAADAVESSLYLERCTGSENWNCSDVAISPHDGTEVTVHSGKVEIGGKPLAVLNHIGGEVIVRHDDSSSVAERRADRAFKNYVADWNEERRLKPKKENRKHHRRQFYGFDLEMFISIAVIALAIYALVMQSRNLP